MYRAVTTKAWVTGPPLESFAYRDPSSSLNIYTDASAYRPDPRDILKRGKMYEAQVVFEPVLVDSIYEEVVRLVTINGQAYTKVR